MRILYLLLISFSFAFNAKSQPLSVSIDVEQPISCIGLSDGSLVAHVTGGNPFPPGSGYYYAWYKVDPGGDIYLSQTDSIATGLSEGQYYVVIKECSDCPDFRSDNYILDNPPGAHYEKLSTPVSCLGGNNGEATVNIYDTDPPFSILWANSSTNNTISNLTAGWYPFTITYRGGCTVTDSVNVTEPSAAIAVDGTITDPSAYLACDGAVDITVTGGNEGLGYTYLWSNSATTQNVSGLCAGNISVTVTDTKGCTVDKQFALIQPNAPLSVSVDVLQPISCPGLSDGSLVAHATGGNPYPPGSGYYYSWFKVDGGGDIFLSQTDSIATGLSAGQYYVVIKECSDCPNFESDRYTLSNPEGPHYERFSTPVSCNGGTNGDATVNLYDAGSSLQWFNSATTNTISGLSAGWYRFTITYGSGCTLTDSVEVTEPSSPIVVDGTITNPSAYLTCDGAVDITVTGGNEGFGYTYLWSNSATTQNVSGVCAGNISVTVTDTKGCTGNKNFNLVGPNPPLSVTIEARQELTCYNSSNGELVAHATGGNPYPPGSGYYYAWYKVDAGGDILLSSTDSIITGLSAGNYYVKVKECSDCPELQSSTYSLIPTSPLYYEIVATPVSCFGGNNGSAMVIYGSGGPYNVVWEGGATTETISNLVPGKYRVTINNSDGCSKLDSTVVVQPDELLLTMDSVNVKCYGAATGSASVSVSGGTPSYTYAWSNTATTEQVTGLQAGLYTVVVTDAKGCSKTGKVNIKEPGPIVISEVHSDVSCHGGANGSIDISVSGGAGGFSYDWGAGQPTTEDRSGLSAGSYSVTVTDANGCSASLNILIGEPSDILLSSTQTNVSCNSGSNGAINLTVSGGTPGYTFNWGAGQPTTEDRTGLSAGIYTVTVTDANGCSKSTSITITEPSAILLSTTQTNVSCNGGSTGTIDLTVSGGTPGYTYNWGTGQPTTEDRTGLSAGNYTVVVTDSKGCAQSISALITENSSLSLSATQTNVSCNGGANGAINLTVTGGTPGYTYNWGAGQPATEDRTGLTAGIYSVIVTDGSGCSKSTSVTITEPSAILLSLVYSDVSCNGGSNGSIDLSVSGGIPGYTYNWGAGQPTSEDRTGLSAGNYSVIVTDANGCSQETSQVINQPTALSVSYIQTNVSCNGGSNGAINLSVSGGTPGYTFNWGAGQPTTEDRTGLTAGAYTVIVTDSKGCSKTVTINITEPSAITLSATQTNVSCNGGANGSINLTVTGGAPGYTFNWGAGQPTTEDRTGLTAGVYTVIVTDANGCTKSISITITEPSGMVLSTTQSNVSCNGGTNGSINLTVTGGTGAYTYNWGAGQPTTEDRTGLAAGNYTVIVTDANGCSKSTSVTITEPSAIALTSVTTNVSCNGGSNGAINLTVNGGTPGYTYNWGAGQPTTEDRTGLTAGNYTVVVTDANGCSKSLTITVAQPSAITLTTTQTNVSCNGGANGSINLTVSGGSPGYTFNWGAGQPTTEDRTGLTAGVYSVTVTDANGCTKSTSVTITQPPALVLTTTQTNVTCNGGANGSINLTVTGGTGAYTYNWGAGQPTTEDRAGLNAGVYTVTVTDANGCTNSTSVTITQPSAISIATSQVNVSCNGGNNGSITLTVSGGAGTYTYNWGAGQPVTKDRTGLTAGLYTVVVTDVSGCTKSASITITQPANIVLTTTQTNVTCSGGSNGAINLTVTGGAGGYTYNWGVGQPTTEDRTGLAAGTYTVVVTDANGCTKTTSVTITEPNPIVLSTTVTNVLCNGASTGAIDLTVTGGTGGYTYNWGAGQPTTQDRTGLAAGSYTVIVTDANGCTKSATINVTQPSAINLQVAQTNVLCNGASTGTIDLTVTGGTPGYTYNWGAGQPTTQDRTGLAAGNYTVIVTDANVCTQSTSVTIIQPSAITLTTTQTNVSCNGASTGAIDLTVAGGAGAYTYNWGPGQPTTQDRTGLAAGTYTVIVTDANGCTKATSVTITQPTPIVLTTTQTNVLCNGASTGAIDLTVSGGTPGYTYNWGAGQPTTQDRTGLAAGTYTVVVTDANGCTKTISVTITQPSPIVLTTTQVNVSCNGGNNGSIDLTVSGGTGAYTYNWGVGQPATQDRTGLAAGTYTVVVTDANGCSKTTSVTISQPATLSIVLSSTKVSCFNGNDGTATAAITGGTTPYQYVWTNGGTTSTISGLTAGSYFVQVRDANLCTIQGSVVVSNATAISLAGVTTNPTCFQSCNGSITLTTSGGTGALSYLWSNGAITRDISGLCAGTYTVVVKDANNCSKAATFTLVNPPKIVIELGPDRTLCSGQTFTADANTGVTGSSYQWTSTNGFTSTASSVTLNQSGTYYVLATTPNGCVAKDTIGIATTSAQIASEFIVSTQAFKGKTVTLVNISTPAPDSIRWIIPANPNITVQSRSQAVCELVFSDTGSYNISMIAYSGQCQKIITKKVNVIQPLPPTNTGNVRDPLIKNFVVSPVPNNGQFTARVQLNEVSSIRLRLINILTNVQVSDRQFSGSDQYQVPYSISVTPGVYLMLLETPVSNRMYKVVIN